MARFSPQARSSLAACALALVVGAPLYSSCTKDDTTEAPPGTMVVFDLEVDRTTTEHFFDVPYPNDLRLDAAGHPILTGFPNPRGVPVVEGLLVNATEAVGFSQLPVAHFRFTAGLAPRDPADVVAADAASPLLLVVVDPVSPRRGELVPLVAKTLAADLYTPEHLLSVAARPGFVLQPDTTYAVVVRRGAKDAAGSDLAVPPALANLAHRAPQTAAESAADAVYAPLWDTLGTLGVPVDDVAAATVFTTGSVVAESSALGAAVVGAYDITVDGLAASTDPADQYPEFCYLKGTVTYPQFQTGTPPFNVETEGRFVFGNDGLPVRQRDEVAPVTVLVPKTPMPDAGYPIMINVHGSCGYSVAAVTPVDDTCTPADPIGCAFPITSKGIAVAGSAMPLNPERLPGASEIEYINPNNIAAMRDTFRQGLVEARLWTEALSKLTIDPAALGSCTGPTLPAGATAFKFDASKVLLTGQSMGGMYANMIGATEPLVKAVVPTGAGGYWTYFFFLTPLQNGAFPGLLRVLLQTPQSELGFLHPVLALGEAALERADPIVYTPRIGRDPLPGHPVRPIYETSALGDSYFPTEIYDAMALAYGHQQAGDVVWPSLQDALALDGLDGLLSFPVEDNRTSADGTPYTGVITQWTADGDYDPHAIYTHRDDVKYQYACFWDSFVKTGHARVPVPLVPWDQACQ